ncbi:unnamed protein product [Fraxinus pennsylvanica]|uniref:Reverse transcriptase Ty1/copia-type domain-containing protein n=1 Tax=Fraxinus pennsylvanica TaxID=56036 RepID=A0AAD2DLX4_9LAMI|nr:unnamed protein product [Fraxinus pennsylvanica]
MLHGNGLAMHFWGESIDTACHIVNMVYLRSKTDMTPYETWKGKRPTLKYFRVFGSKCYILRDRENLGKFHSKNDVRVFLGYSRNSRSYSVYNSRTRVVMESINIMVDDACSEGEIGKDWGKLEPLSIDPVMIIEPKETSVPDPRHTSDGLDTPNKDSSPDDRPTLPKEPSSRVKTNHPKVNIIENLDEWMRLRKRVLNNPTHARYVSQIEPKKVENALRDECWINTTHEEPNIWDLVPRPDDCNVIGTKWIFKTDDQGTILEIRLGFKLYQIDVKNAFLNEILQEEAYVEQSKGFVDSKFPHYVYKLNKALYGLKQAPRACKKHTRTPMNISVKLGHDSIGKSIDKTLYRSMIGSLFYLTVSRPDIAFSVGVCAHFHADTMESHLSIVQRIIRYVNGTVDYGIMYSRDSTLDLASYSEADWARKTDDRKHTSGGCFYVGANLVA